MGRSLRSKPARDAVHTAADRPRHPERLVSFGGGLLAHTVSYYLLYLGASENLIPSIKERKTGLLRVKSAFLENGCASARAIGRIFNSLLL